MIIPDIIKICSGIKVSGQLLKSFLFSTDVAIIRNTSADAIIAIYPFTPQPLITQSLILASDKPIFCGVGGGPGSGERSVKLAIDAENQGALGVVLNTNSTNDLIRKLKENISIPVVFTIVSQKVDIKGKIEAGADIFNVSGADKTSDIVKRIRTINSDIAIIATGGKDEENIKAAIESGANAISFTPPSTGELFREMMDEYRNE
jgi:NAD(P)H-dependent flavin oxidoreductase YrpB (nitropropane dioxygenase family)